jgi:TIR domain
VVGPGGRPWGLPMPNVFISYSRRDGAYVDELVAFLQANDIPAWADKEIHHGDHWEDVIVTQIGQCAAFVPVMTPDAWASPWVRNEVGRARLKEKPILPLLRAGDHFFGLSHLEAEDVTRGQLPTDAFVARLRSLVDGRPDAVPGPYRSTARRPRRRPGWLRPALVAVAVLAIVGAAVTLVNRNRAADGPASAHPSSANQSSARPTGTAATGSGDLAPVVEHLSTPETVGGMILYFNAPSSDAGSATFGFEIKEKTGSAYLLYRDAANTGAQVSLLAATGAIPKPDVVIADYLTSLDRNTLQDVDPGRLSGIAKCGTLAGDGTIVGCVWADPGSLGQLYCYYRPQDECATLFTQFRDSILVRD